MPCIWQSMARLLVTFGGLNVMSYVKSDALCTPRHQQVCQCITCAPVGSSFYQCGNAELPLEKLTTREAATGRNDTGGLPTQSAPAVQAHLHTSLLQCAQVKPATASVHTNVFQQHVLNFSSVSSNVLQCPSVSSNCCAPVCTIQACHW